MIGYHIITLQNGAKVIEGHSVSGAKWQGANDGVSVSENRSVINDGSEVLGEVSGNSISDKRWEYCRECIWREQARSRRAV
jgi:hypothetical protein